MANHKRNRSEKPLISIVTVTYNSEKYLPQTIRSVMDQDFTDYEYLIIDGGSTDRTLDIIRQSEQGIDYWKSGPDNGIFDAMNQGLRSARGRYVCFLNSDDYFADSSVLAKVAEGISQNPGSDILYGYVLCLDPGTGEIFRGGGGEYRKSDFKRLKLFEHPASFVRREALEKLGGFDTGYRLSADTELFMRMILAGCTHVFIDIPVTVYRFGGASSGALEAAREYRRMMAKNQKNPFLTLYLWCYVGLQFSLRARIRRLLEITGLIEVWRRIKKSIQKRG